MSMNSASLLPVPVKDVRAAAQVVLKMRQESTTRKLTELAENMNTAISVNNSKWWRKLLKMQPQPLLNVEDTVDGWMEDSRLGRLPCHSSPWWILLKTRSDWWKRLVQLSKLPVIDDDRVMLVSVSDLDLIAYNIWREEQAVKCLLKEQA